VSNQSAAGYPNWLFDFDFDSESERTGREKVLQHPVSNDAYLSYFGSPSKIRSAKSKARVIMAGPRDRANSPRALHTVSPYENREASVSRLLFTNSPNKEHMRFTRLNIKGSRG
jgi:hypothetical protein